MLRCGLAMLVLALVACGGGAKKGGTTPTAKGKTGGQDAASMKDGDPVGDGTPDRPGGDGGPGGDAGGPSGTAGGTGEEPAVVITPPNFDPDPAQARTQVEQHLSVARNALKQSPADGETALREAKKALTIDAANTDAAAMVAHAYFHKKLYDTAELVLDDLYKREAAKNNANVNYVYGLVYDATNRPERALLAYQKSVSIDPNHGSALTNLGVHQLKNSQYADAQQTFERLTRELGRSDAVTRTSLGSAYRGRAADYPATARERADFVARAEAEYKRALQANQSYGPAYYNLGLLYLDNDPFPGVADTLTRLNAAKAFFDQYKNMPGVDIKLYDDRMKDVTKAIKRAEKAAKKKKP